MKQQGLLGLALAAAAAGWSGGCDERGAADQQVRERIAEARLALHSRTPSPEKAESLLAEAAAESAASEHNLAQAKAMLAQTQYESAIKLLPEIADHEAKAINLLNSISDLGTAVASDNRSITNYRASNPTGENSKPLKTMEAQRDKLSARSTQLDQLIGEAAKKVQAAEANVTDLAEKQRSAANEAAALAEKSEQAQQDGKGEDSVKLFKEAAAARQRASTVAMSEVPRAKEGLSRAQEQIAGLKAEKEAVDTARENTLKQIAAINGAWTKTQKVIEARSAAAKALVGEGGISTQAKELAKELSAANDVRDQALALLEKSAANFQAASKAAGDLLSRVDSNIKDDKYRGLPQVEAWRGLLRAASQGTFQLGRAQALFVRADLLMRQRNMLQLRDRLSTDLASTIKAAGAALPDELAGKDLAAQAKKAGDDAAEDLKAADELLADIIERPAANQPSEVMQARSLRMHVQFALHTLTGAGENLTMAQSLAKSFGDEGKFTLPRLPGPLESQINRAAGAGAGAGSTTPAATGPATPAATGTAAPAAATGETMPEKTDAAPATGEPGAAAPAAPANPGQGGKAMRGILGRLERAVTSPSGQGGGGNQ